MATFRFSLETLLRHREDIEQREKEALLRLTYRYQNELRRRDDLSAQYRQTMEEFSRIRFETDRHEDLNLYHRYLNRLAHEIDESGRVLVQLESEVQAQKEAVIDASRKRKTLASLKSKKEQEFVAAAEKQAQKEIDDLVITRFGTGDSVHRKAGGPDGPEHKQRS